MGSMDAYREDDHVRVAKSHCSGNDEAKLYKMYRKSAQTGTGRKSSEGQQISVEYERVSENERKSRRDCTFSLKRRKMRA